MHGNAPAFRRFSKELDTDIQKSSVYTLKLKYLAEVNFKQQLGEADTGVTGLTLKKRGIPLMLGELDGEVKHYIKAAREGGGVITTAIIMAAATAILSRADRKFFSVRMGVLLITLSSGRNPSCTEWSSLKEGGVRR